MGTENASLTKASHATAVVSTHGTAAPHSCYARAARFEVPVAASSVRNFKSEVRMENWRQKTMRNSEPLHIQLQTNGTEDSHDARTTEGILRETRFPWRTCRLRLDPRQGPARKQYYDAGHYLRQRHAGISGLSGKR